MILSTNKSFEDLKMKFQARCPHCTNEWIVDVKKLPEEDKIFEDRGEYEINCPNCKRLLVFLSSKPSHNTHSKKDCFDTKCEDRVDDVFRCLRDDCNKRKSSPS